MLSCMSASIDIPAADSRMLWFQEVLNCNLNTRSLHALVTSSKHTWLSLKKKYKYFVLEKKGKERKETSAQKGRRFAEACIGYHSPLLIHSVLHIY